MKLLDQLLAETSQPHKVQVPEGGPPLFVRVMSGLECAEFRRQVKAVKDSFDAAKSAGVDVSDADAESEAHLMALLVSFSACDELGNRLFSSEERHKALQLPHWALVAMANESSKLNGFTGQDDREKKSPTTPT